MGILYNDGCRIVLSIFWVDIPFGILIVDSEWVRGRYNITLDDFGVFDIVFVVTKLFSMKDVIRAFLVKVFSSAGAKS